MDSLRESLGGSVRHRSHKARYVNSLGIVNVTAQLITQLVAIALITPAVVLPGVAIFCIGAWFGNIYMKAQLPVKREMSIARAPVLSHFSAAFSGLGELLYICALDRTYG